MSSSNRKEIWAVIKLCQELGKTPAETFNMLKETSHKDKMSQTTACSSLIKKDYFSKAVQKRYPLVFILMRKNHE